MNIVKNAVEAIEEKYKNSDSAATGHVGAALEIGPGGEVVIRVTDDGIGLPEARDAIDEPYMTTRQGGPGLGLAIVQPIGRTEERRGGRGVGRTCRSRWWPDHE